MAIIIPSKNIYEMNNPKIRDNVIDNVSVGYTTTKQLIENSQQVYNTDVPIIEINEIGDFIEQREEKDDFVVANLSMRAVIGIKTGYNTFSFSFSKLQSNKYIKDVYVGKDSNGKPNINIQTIYKKYNGTATAETNVFWQNSGKWTYDYLDLIYNNDFDEAKGELPLEASLKEYYSNTTNPNYFIETSLSVPSESNITNEEILTISNDTYDIEGLKCLTYVEIYKMTEFSGAPPQKPYKLNGTCEKYIATMLEISFMGDTIGIDLTDGSVTYGSGNKPHSLSGNELIQDSGKVNGVALTKHLANNVLSQYAKGKETATLLCSISDYYDEENAQKITANNFQIIGENDYTYRVDNLEIGENDYGIMQYNHIAIIELNKPATTNILFSISGVHIGIGIGGTVATYSYIDDKSETPDFLEEIEIISQEPKMTFEIGENVIPMVFGANGKDQPMSKNQDGSAKVFEIIGINFIYDGAVWQEISLLEKTTQTS
jgi:hypothetical protein